MMRLLAALVAGALLAGALPAGATPGPADAPEYWFDSWHVEQLWKSGARGQGVTIAEIDTGVNASLPELSGRILRGRDFGDHGDGRVDHEVDAFGHGTAMASIMVAHPGPFDITGLAPSAKILPIAVPLVGTSDAGQSGQLGPAIRYAADHGADVISMSLGGKRYHKYDDVACPYDEQQAIFHALRKGVIVVASVGNTGPTANTIEEPAVCLGVIAVGSVDAAGTVAGFSGRQPYLTLVAPGVSIPSLGRVVGQAYSGDGTSQSTALVSASLALLRSKYPHASSRSLVTRLLATLDAHRSKPSPSYGYGLLNTYRALTAHVRAGAPNPVYAAAAPFLAANAAHVAHPSAPAPAAHGLASTGTYSIGSAPRIHSPQVLTGAGLAAVGLLALLVLLVVGVRRRRGARAALDMSGFAPHPMPYPHPLPYPHPEYRPRPGPGPGPHVE